MNFFSRFGRGRRTSPGRERSPETDAYDHTPPEYLPPDDVGGQYWNRRRDTTSRWAQYSSGGRRPWEAYNPRRPSNGRFAGGGRRPPQSRDTFWDTQRPPAFEWMAREEVADENSNSNATAPRPQAAETEADSSRGPRAPRFRDVDLEFNDNNVDDISGGARVVTGLHAGRDFTARINNNTFGRRLN